MGRYYNVIEKGEVKRYYGEHVSRIVSGSGTLAAGVTLGDIALDKDLLITNIRAKALMTVTLAATGVADAPKRAIGGLDIIGDGKNFLALSGGTQLGRMLALLNQMDTQGASLDANTDVARATLNQFYHFHPGHNQRDRFDMSAYIPARALTNLVARVTCPVAASMDSGANITAGNYSFEIDGVQGVPISKDAYYPSMLVQALPHTAISAAYAVKQNVPTGGYVRRIILMCDDATATTPLRSDAQVTGVRLTISKQSMDQITHSLLGLKYANAQKYGFVGDAQPTALGAVATTRPGYNGAMHQPIGFGILDLRDYYHPFLGMNMIGATQGDVILGLTTGVATGTTYILYDMLFPMEPQWVGK